MKSSSWYIHSQLVPYPLHTVNVFGPSASIHPVSAGQLQSPVSFVGVGVWVGVGVGVGVWVGVGVGVWVGVGVSEEVDV